MLTNSKNYSLAAPTTEAQRELWATMQMRQEASLCYNEVIELSLKGNLNFVALKESLQFILNKHDILRSVYSADGKTFFIKESLVIHLPCIDLTNSENPVEEFTRIKQDEVLTPFDIQNGTCIRFVLVKTHDQVHSLLVSAHHIVCDGWSFAILLSEIGQAYSAKVLNQETPSSDGSQFVEYAIEELKNTSDNSHKSFWFEQFKLPLKVNTFPTDFVRPAYRTYASQFLKIDIADDLAKKVKRLGITQGCSLYNVLMANFMILIKRISQSQDIVVGVASAAQSGTGKHDLVGHLVNLLPLKTSLDEDLVFTKFLRSLRTTMLDAFEHQFFSYGTLLKGLNITRKAGEIPLLNCVFNIDQQSPGQGLDFSNLKASYAVVPREYENFELFVNIVSLENSLSIECQYNSTLFEKSTVENWLQCYIELLNLCIERPDAQVKDFVLLNLKIPTPNSKDQLVKLKNAERNLEAEARLGILWMKVLGVKKITQDDNFFVLGGHSLLAVELANLVQNEFKKEISIRDIFENPTIAELASRLADLSQVELSQTKLELHPEIMEGPVSHNQLQTWYVEELFPETRMHNLSTSLRIKWDVSPQILEKTVHYFLQRHDALRTAILVENDRPYQKIFDRQDPLFLSPLEVIKTEEKDVFELMRAETAKPFDKKVPPMFRAKLYQLGKSDYIFFIIVHHAVWDGWCFDIFFEELDVIYTAIEKGESPVFQRNPEVRYLDHTIWMDESIRGGDFIPQLNYWKNKLKAPLPILDIPSDFKRPKIPSHDGGNFRFNLNKEQIAALKNYSASHNVSIFNIMLTAFKITLAHQTGLDDIVVGSPIRGRNTPELQQTIGYFVNTLALRSKINLDQGFEANLKRVTSTCLEAFSNQDLPFEYLLRELDYNKDMSRTAIFQTFFTFQDMTNRNFFINERPVKQVSVNNASVKTDLDIWVKVTTTSIEGAFEFRSDLFKTSTVERIYKIFEGIIENLLSADAVKQSLPVLLKNQTPVQVLKPLTILPCLSGIPQLSLSLVPLRKGGSLDPVFFFHGVGGNILNYVPLVKFIDGDRPVYALQTQGMDGSVKLKETIESMATAYIREMKAISYEGPYTLIGGSMGGMIALEVAQQLKLNNDQVKSLIMLDTFGPDINIQQYDKSERSFFENLKISLFYRSKTMKTRIRKFIYSMIGLYLPLEDRIFNAEMTNYRALWKYRPKILDGDIVLIRAKLKSQGWYSDLKMGWGKIVTGEIKTIEIDGDHSSFIESPDLGKALRNCFT
jgi:non-ribosomal peptide synthetase component F/thioesterase domain-containing protein/acyl carrier protein